MNHTPASVSRSSRSVSLSATITILLRVALVVAAAVSALTGHWMTLFASLGTLGLTFVPTVVATSMNVRLPLQFEVLITSFIYAAMFLGEIVDYYGMFWWWDMALHASSAFAFGFAGFLIMYMLLIRDRLRASPFLVAMFSFCFAMSIGALWEVFEFFMDNTFGTEMLKSGIDDTIWDLIVDALGALIASVTGYIYLRFRIRDPFDMFIDWIIQANPSLQRPVFAFQKSGRSIITKDIKAD